MNKTCNIKIYDKNMCPHFNTNDESCSYYPYNEENISSNCFMSMTRGDIIREIINARNNTIDARNRMGCSENWYDSYYAISKTFTDKQIYDMTYRELLFLIKLGDRMSEAFY